MVDDMVPKICLQFLILNRHTQYFKYNWVAQTNAIIVDTCIFIDYQNLNTEFFESQIPEIIELYQNFSHEKDIERLEIAKFDDYYKSCLTRNLQIEKYLLLNFPFYSKCNVAQMRLSFNHIVKFTM